MSIRWDWLATGLLVACAVTTTAAVIRHEFVASHESTPSAPLLSKPVFREDWPALLAHGVQIGPPDAKAQIVEFADFECPFCEQMHSTLSQLRRRYPADLAITFIHYPLEQHRFAESASRVAECAGNQGRFEAMHDVLFASQRDFGIRPWAELADEAGVPSIPALEECMKDATPLQRVVEGKRLASQLNVAGTPTLIVNGWQFGAPPTPQELESMIKLILAGKDPLADS